MSAALSVVESKLPSLSMNETELVKVLQSSLYPGAKTDSIKLVLSYCKAAGYDPMQKPVHIVPMWDGKEQVMRDVIMPGVGLYRTQAARTGQLAGMSEPEFGEDVTEKIGGVETTYPKWCRVTVRRRLQTGEIVEFTAREFWKENYAVKGGKDKSIAPNAMWTKRPYAQLAKCAQAQALRIAFPEATGSEATADEMEGREIRHEVEVKAEPEQTPPRTDEQFTAALEKWVPHIESGKKTHDEIIAFAESKAPLTDEQKKQILLIKAPTKGDAPESTEGEQE